MRQHPMHSPQKTRAVTVYSNCEILTWHRSLDIFCLFTFSTQIVHEPFSVCCEEVVGLMSSVRLFMVFLEYTSRSAYEK
jgi:hypothetical protein